VANLPRLSATPLPSAREVAIGKDPFAVRGFAECNWHSAKTGSPVVAHRLKHHKNEEALYSHVAGTFFCGDNQNI